MKTVIINAKEFEVVNNSNCNECYFFNNRCGFVRAKKHCELNISESYRLINDPDPFRVCLRIPQQQPKPTPFNPEHLKRWIQTNYIRTGLIVLNADELADVIEKAVKYFIYPEQ